MTGDNTCSYMVIKTLYPDLAEELIKYLKKGWNLKFWTQPGTENYIQVMTQCNEATFQVLGIKAEAFRNGWLACEEILTG